MSGISICRCTEQATIFFFKLMSSCHKNDQESKILVAECLGELGAVDPGRLVYITFHDFSFAFIEWDCSAIGKCDVFSLVA